jgi:hypothetical protein
MAFFGVAAAGADSGGKAAAVAAAHARLLHDKTLQFDFAAPPPIPPVPDWLIQLGRFIAAIAPLLQWVVYGGLALGAVLLLLFIGRELISQRFPQWFRPKVLKDGPARSADWKLDLAKAKVLLADADRLAAEGRYAEAAHLLLFRTVDDIDGRRPNLVRPSQTSRDIADLGDLPGPAREAFRVIMQVVERSFFGGRPLDASSFGECRRAYEAFIAPDVWA